MQLLKLPSASAAVETAALAGTAYAVLPVRDAFEVITANLWPEGLPQVPLPSRPDGATRRASQSAIGPCAPCGGGAKDAGVGGTSGYTWFPDGVHSSELVLEMCGDRAHEQVEHLADELAKYTSIWPADTTSCTLAARRRRRRARRAS